MEQPTAFKTCPCCATRWESKCDFLSDPALDVNGYQVNMEDLEKGLIFFTHKQNDCHSTLAIPVSEFLDQYSGPRYTENKALSPECPRYCIDESNLERCEVICECAFVREMLHMIHESKGIKN